MKYLFIGFLSFWITSSFAQQASQAPPRPYNEEQFQEDYASFIESLDPMTIAKDYPKAIEKLLSIDPEKRLRGINILKETKELDIIPWLIPYFQSDHEYVRLDAYQAIESIVTYYVLQRRDMQAPGIVIKPRKSTDPDLRPLAWLILKMLRLPDTDPSIRSAAATMTGYLNLWFFEGELKELLNSQHPATVQSATYALELLQTAHPKH